MNATWVSKTASLRLKSLRRDPARDRMPSSPFLPFSETVMETKKFRGWLLAATLGSVGLFLSFGCKSKNNAPTADSGTSATADSGAYAGEISTAVQQEADQTFLATCAVCHGTDGKGSGPGGKFLVPKPRNFTDAKWQASVTDGHIEQVIKFGGAAVGLSPAMPA